jgi:hypothetical protein
MPKCGGENSKTGPERERKNALRPTDSDCEQLQPMASSSTSKIRVEFGGMAPG